MKKAIIIILITVVLAISVVGFIGCDDENPYNIEAFNNRFVILKEKASMDVLYMEMYDKDTKVMYIFVKCGNAGSLTVLVNADGTPMLYEGE